MFCFASSLRSCVALAGTKLAKENEPEENPLGFCFASSLRSCVALARTKLAKENEPEENPLGFSEYNQTKQLIIHVVSNSTFLNFK